MKGRAKVAAVAAAALLAVGLPVANAAVGSIPASSAVETVNHTSTTVVETVAYTSASASKEVGCTSLANGQGCEFVASSSTVVYRATGLGTILPNEDVAWSIEEYFGGCDPVAGGCSGHVIASSPSTKNTKGSVTGVTPGDYIFVINLTTAGRVEAHSG